MVLLEAGGCHLKLLMMMILLKGTTVPMVLWEDRGKSEKVKEDGGGGGYPQGHLTFTVQGYVISAVIVPLEDGGKEERRKEGKEEWRKGGKKKRKKGGKGERRN